MCVLSGRASCAGGRAPTRDAPQPAGRSSSARGAPSGRTRCAAGPRASLRLARTRRCLQPPPALCPLHESAPPPPCALQGTPPHARPLCTIRPQLFATTSRARPAIHTQHQPHPPLAQPPTSHLPHPPAFQRHHQGQQAAGRRQGARGQAAVTPARRHPNAVAATAFRLGACPVAPRSRPCAAPVPPTSPG